MSRGRVTLGAAALVVACSLTGCASGSDPSTTGGVDTLVIPTPSPDPDDFVDTIDNPWLPLERGAVWVYERRGYSDMEVTVLDEPGMIEGVTTTAVLTRNLDGYTDVDHVDYYAQDRDGNVWWFGREGGISWEAGVDGAEAGLAMAATPRQGDGYWLALLDGLVEDRARVVSVADDEVVIEVRSELDPDLSSLESYAPDVGLVSRTSANGIVSSWELVSGP